MSLNLKSLIGKLNDATRGAIGRGSRALRSRAPITTLRSSTIC